MKKILIASLLSVGAIGAYAQGTVTFSDLQTGSPGVVFHIYAPLIPGATSEQIGNATTAFAFSSGFFGGDNPVGGSVTTLPGQSSPTTIATANWSGYTAVGGSAGTGTATLPPNYTLGSQFSVGLLAAAGDNASLNPQTSLATGTYPPFYTTSTSAAGLLNGTDTITVPVLNTSGTGIGAVPADYHATVAVVAWWNGNGTISLAQAVTTTGDVWGESNPVNMDALGQPASVTTGSLPEALYGVESFSMKTTNTVPEPSMIALGLVGVGGFLARRRKK